MATVRPGQQWLWAAGIALLASLSAVSSASDDPPPESAAPTESTAPRDGDAAEPPASDSEEGDTQADEPTNEGASANNSDGDQTDSKADDEDHAASDPPRLPDEVAFTEFVTLPMVGIYGRATVHVDSVEAALAAGELTMPRAGDRVTSPDERTVEWRSATADNQGRLSTRSIVGGYAATQFDAPVDGMMLLRATGHAAVYVNGQPMAGDPYGYGHFDLPVDVQKGENTFLFQVAGGELSARLVRPASPVTVLAGRETLPSLVRDDDAEKVWAAVALANCSDAPLTGAKVVATLAGGESTTTPVAWLDRGAVASVPFEIAVANLPQAPQVKLDVRIETDEQVLAQQQYELEVVEQTDLQLRTFRSRIDRSVQSYAVLPARTAVQDERQLVSDGRDSSATPGAIVALHDQGISAREFAQQYTAKPWAHVIAPRGRGLVPLDWEDWARIDAIEACDDAAERLEFDDDRMYATGHGMGGHGALVLATTAPDRFAAVGTSAAWPSLWTYGGGRPNYRDPSGVQSRLLRGTSSSDTLAHLANLQGTGVYLLHGSDDEQVPAEQSRMILRELADWHRDVAYFERPSAGHRWDRTAVEWPEMMRFFRSRSRDNDNDVEQVTFATADLQVAASRHWATIAAQERLFAVSRIELERRSNPTAIVGTTTNVERLSIDESAVPPDKPFVVRLDGGRPVIFRGMPASGRVWLEKRDGRWQRSVRPDPGDKGPNRNGGLKAVFDHDVLLVYGTLGNDAENAWSRAKAHFDAQTFAYRAGGSLDVVPDTQFDRSATRDRNVVLYGNVDTNRAWAGLLSTSPIQVRRDRITVGARAELGEGLGFVLVRPRRNSDTRLVAAIGGTGLDGMRLTNRLRYFWSGVAYPDLMILGPESLREGDADVRAAGYFAEDWELEESDIAWRDLAL